LAYRNFGDHEALVVDHAVDAGSGKAGMRWYEIRNPAGTPTIYQQGTYAPDAASRWGGSIALDHVGDMAMGYSASSSSVSPAVRYTGRLVGDALGSMAQGEGVFAAGTGSQSSGNRWGDYSDMTVDPSDDCTFWYTSEYVDSAGNWKTRIGNFKFATCSSGPTPTPTNTPIPGPTNTPTPAPPPGTIQNGGFETGSVSSWTVDGSLPAPVASTTQKHAGSYSALLGATSGNEPNGDSSLYQSFTVPSGGGTLSFWYRPTTADTISYDWQDAYLQNSSGSTVATLLHVASNTQVWTNVTYNLASYAGQTMRIKFLVHEDGCTCNDLTSMYVDDVTVSGAGPTPTNTPVPPTNTPAPPTNTPVPPTNTPTPGASVVSNGGFETGSFSPWVIASTLPSPAVTTAKAHTGTHSALLGTTSGSEPNGDGAFYQTVTVPASGGTLSFWYLPASADSISYDWQDAYVTDTSGNVLATVLHVCSNTQAWTNVNFSMAAYAGQTVRIKFLVHQDGYGDLTSMYVDDVSVH
ncbi:MAG TPA: choice-of-anchor J domain-containing protein, partial [Chloroflexia bacterium]|nr:choice-of-anchor J domain-containing protein [Chloroflexia bacterium]